MMMNKPWILAGALVLALAGCKTTAVQVDDGLTASDCASAQAQRLITYCSSPQAADLALRNAELMGQSTTGGDVPYSPLPVGDSPTRGEAEAPVTIVMFTDLECPYCHQMHETLETVRDASPGDVRIVFKHTPLSFHPNAVPAALGALAAREQGKFWEYVDRVYANQEEMGDEALLAHADALGLDLEKFRNDFGSDTHVAKIESDLALAGQVGVQGTPTMFVNGIRVIGVYPPTEVAALVAQQKQLVERLAEAGVNQDDLYWRLVAVQYDVQQAEQLKARAQAEPEYAEPEPVVAHVPVDGAPVKGAAADEALVTIVEFSDFQCPYCSAATGPLDNVLAIAPDTTRLAFRHFPLPNHPHAAPAAAASMVAQEAGKFWEYHDRLFAAQDDLSDEALVGHAEAVGVDPAEVRAALRSAERQARIEADQQIGLASGVQGTPTIFVNGVMVLGMSSEEEFLALVKEQEELARAVSEETGLTGDALYEAVVKQNQAAAAAE